VATTSLWRVTSRLDKVVTYVKNPAKTTDHVLVEGQTADTTDAALENEQWLSNAIGYAMQDYKTSIGNFDKDVIIHDEDIEVVRSFVSGIGCTPEIAYDEMMAVKRQFGKTGGTVAYHGYQSFAEGEVTPELAHEIGVKLAEKLWGERHQVVVTTHLDKETHLHNHFVLNTVSFVDGLKFYRSEQDYHNMRKESDSLCRENGLSVVEAGYSKSKHHAEWQAEQNNKPTWRSLVQSDVDTAIRQSMTERQFFENLKKAGYAIKIGKDITVRPPGKERGLKLRRNFGTDYSIEGIRRRILAQYILERRMLTTAPPPKQARLRGSVHKGKRMGKLRARYYYYLYRMGVLPQKRTNKHGHKSNRQLSRKQVHFLFREDIRHMQDIAREIRFMAVHGIDTAEQLAAHKDDAGAQLAALADDRKRLRNQARTTKDETAIPVLKADIAALSTQITTLRQEVKLCENIERRSADMTDKLHRAKEPENNQNPKERNVKNHEYIK